MVGIIFLFVFKAVLATQSSFIALLLLEKGLSFLHIAQEATVNSVTLTPVSKRFTLTTIFQPFVSIQSQIFTRWIKLIFDPLDLLESLLSKSLPAVNFTWGRGQLRMSPPGVCFAVTS